MADSPVGPPEDHFAWRYFTGRKDSKRWESALTQAQAFIKAERVEVVDLKVHVTPSSKVAVLLIFRTGAPQHDGRYELHISSRARGTADRTARKLENEALRLARLNKQLVSCSMSPYDKADAEQKAYVLTTVTPALHPRGRLQTKLVQQYN